MIEHPAAFVCPNCGADLLQALEVSDADKVALMRKSGMTLRAISVVMGCSVQTIHNIRLRAEEEIVAKARRRELGPLEDLADDFPLEATWLSTRAINTCRNERLFTVGDVRRRTDAELLRIQNLGRHTLSELRRLGRA